MIKTIYDLVELRENPRNPLYKRMAFPKDFQNNSNSKFGKMEKAKVSKQHFRRLVNRKPNFLTN